MIINIICWVGGYCFSIIFNKAKNQILKIVFKKTIPQLIRYHEAWHIENETYLQKLRQEALLWAEWILVD